MHDHTHANEIVPAGTISVRMTNGTLANLTQADFHPNGAPAALALAYVSPDVDFAAATTALSRLAGATPVVAVVTAGELCGGCDALYRSDEDGRDSIAVQIFPADLFAAVSIQSVPLPDGDIRSGKPLFDHENRVNHMVQSLMLSVPPFAIDVHDSLALTFIDGLSSCEHVFMEAIYRSELFPCLFIGGSTGGVPDAMRLYDSRQCLTDHAVCIFLKLREGRGYGVLKSQNFLRTTTSFVAIDADPLAREVRTVVDPESGKVVPCLEALARMIGVEPPDVLAGLQGNTFAVEIEDELFVRSVRSVNVEAGSVTFYCDVSPGDRLQFLQATDFAEQTRIDIESYLHDKPPPLGAVLNDCILRRLHNRAQLGALSGVWPMPVAGFSTFGELFGINVNETLTALVFFDTRQQKVRDQTVDAFPIHYARFCSYFVRRNLNRLQVLSDLRLLPDRESYQDGTGSCPIRASATD